jgi:hypothetical protein
MSRVLAVLIVVLLTPLAGRAQDIPPQDLKVLAIGGFLGQLDGWCEEPGGTYDLSTIAGDAFLPCADISGDVPAKKDPLKPVSMGGLVGARAWVPQTRPADTILVIPGNNQVANFTFLDENRLFNLKNDPVEDKELEATVPRDQQVEARFRRFWQKMADLKADAIGLGSEDFVRSLRDPREHDAQGNRKKPAKNRPSILYRWLQQVKALPIIGSNVVVKLKEPRWFEALNDVEEDDYSLEGITDDDSAAWLTKLTVNHPKDGGVTLNLFKVGSGVSLATATTIKGETSTELTLKQDGALEPATAYEVVATVNTTTTARMNFRTHYALTPRAGSGAGLAGFPVVTRDWAPGAPVVIVNLVDPDVKKLVGAGAWAWQGAGCPAHECEIDILSPISVMESIVSRTYPPAATGPKPFIVLISSLSDEQTEDVLTAFPEIRMVVLPQESYMLGRASRSYVTTEDKGQLAARLARRNNRRSFSGDLGLFGVVTGGKERTAATMLVSRPEWIGEVAATMSARVGYSADEWHVHDPVVTSQVVPGAALEWDPGPCPGGPPGGTGCTVYSIKVRGQANNTPYGSFEPYQLCPTTPALQDRCDMIASLGDLASFNTFAGDALRRATGSESAYVPGDLVDSDGHAWLKSVLSPSNTRVLTRFTLERLVYRSFRIVRATVSGEELVGTLDQALKSTTHEDSCLVGIGDKCVASVDTEHDDRVTVNDRAVDPRLYYSIAMPEGLAENLKLEHSEGRWHTTDAVSALHERLNDKGPGGWYVNGSGGSLATRITEQGNKRDQYNVAASSLEFGYTRLHLDTPPGQNGTLDTLDVDFRSVKPYRTITTKVDFDVALVDLPWMAFRAITTANFNRRTDIKKTGNQITYPDNELTYGGRWDYKTLFKKREIRWYAGYFVERELEGPQEYLSAATVLSAEGDPFETRQTHGIPILYTQDALRFQFGAAGVDFINPKKFLTDSWLPIDVTRGSIQYGWGRLHHVPTGVSIAGDIFPFKRTKADGNPETVDAETILGEFYSRNPREFRLTSFSAQDTVRDQNRLQAELHFEAHPTMWSKEWKLGVEVRYREYWYPTAEDGIEDFLKDYWRTRLKLTVQVKPRFELVPMLEYHNAGVSRDGADRFSHTKFEVTLKVPFVVRTGWGWLFR